MTDILKIQNVFLEDTMISGFTQEARQIIGKYIENTLCTSNAFPCKLCLNEATTVAPLLILALLESSRLTLKICDLMSLPNDAGSNRATIVSLMRKTLDHLEYEVDVFVASKKIRHMPAEDHSRLKLVVVSPLTSEKRLPVITDIEERLGLDLPEIQVKDNVDVR